MYVHNYNIMYIVRIIQFRQIFLQYSDTLSKFFPSLQFQYSLLLIGTFLNLTGVSVLKRRNPVSLFFYLLIGMLDEIM